MKYGMNLSKHDVAVYGPSREPIAVCNAVTPPIEILDEIEVRLTSGEWRGEDRPCVVWRWSDKKDVPHLSGVRDLANDEGGFRAGRRWIKFSECERV